MTDNDRLDEALIWHIRLSDQAASADDWGAFTQWLEADVANADAYDKVAMADDQLSQTLAQAPTPHLAQNDNEHGPVKWFQRRAFQGLAATLVMALLASPMLLPDRDLDLYTTRLGEVRDIALNDGSKISMNGGTRLYVDSETHRFAKLESGEAVFTIRHDASNPFVVETDMAKLQDVGTDFNVRRDGENLDVSVAEGAVRYNPDNDAVTVSSGKKLRASKANPVPIISTTDPQTVAGWRRGQLSYQDSPLSEVAIDLSRAIGEEVTVASDLQEHRFTGVIQVEKDRKLLFRRLEGLLSVRAKHTASGWQLTS